MARAPVRLAPRGAVVLAAALSLCHAVWADPARTEILPASEQAAWNAIGRVNIAGYNRARMCSGVLVSPTRVLTAAHCVTLRGGAVAAPSDVVFVAGWRGGATAGDARGGRITLHAGFMPGVASGEVSVGTDLAAIDLAHPVSGIDPLPLGRLADLPQSADAPPFVIISYRADRPHIATRHAPCALTHRTKDAAALDCRVAQGSSGGPVLQQRAEGWRVVGIVAASGPRGTLAALPEAWTAE